MSQSLPLLRKNITLQEALDEDDDILQELSYPEKRLKFFIYLIIEHRSDIEAIVAFHLGVPKTACKMTKDYTELRHGSFNACIPVYIDESVQPCVKKVFIRFPLPYKVGESHYPGNADEKLRCEVATYIWIQSNCPDVPIPCLRGFAFPGERSFTAPENAPFLSRVSWFLRRRVFSLCGYPVPSRYISRKSPCNLEVGYLIIDCVEKGEMLSESWEKLRHDQDRRSTLFKDLSKIILSLSRFPFPRIGSLTIDNSGITSLTNRPLTHTLHQLENSNIPTDIPRHLTYSTTDAYLSDYLACHDSRIRYMPNSIHNTTDGYDQLSALTMMRALLRHFVVRDLRHGPFTLMLTDIHQSNIFVDGDWHITAMIDLEWACTRPIEMQHPPYWLTSCAIDHLSSENLKAYSEVHSEFLEAFAVEERLLGESDTPYTRIMRKGWEVGSYWYMSALDCPKGLYSLFNSHILRRYAKYADADAEFDRKVSAYWSTNAADFVAAKLKEKELYSDQLRKIYSSIGDLGMGEYFEHPAN